MKIHKYHLEVTDKQTVKLPPRSRILSCQEQHGELQLWAMVDDKVHDYYLYVDRSIRIVGTGNPIDFDIEVYTFLGTVQINNFVWHVFYL